MCEDPPTECLDNYDDLDLDNHRQRRLAIYSLEDYYGTILSEYGREYLDFSPGDTSQGIGTQWNKAKSRFKRLDGIEIPNRYNSVIHNLKNERNTEVAHDYQANPSSDVLEDARALAEEWADWFIEHCESYAEMQEGQTAEEMVDDMVNNITDSILSDDIEYYDSSLQDKHASLENRAVAIQEDLAVNIERNSLSLNNGVNKELIQVLLDAVEIRNDKQDLDSMHNHQMEKIKRKEDIRKSENTYRCIVADEYDDYFGTVHVITHEYNHPDTSYVINVSEFTEHEEYLKKLDVDDEISIEVDRNIHGREFVREIG